MSSNGSDSGRGGGNGSAVNAGAGAGAGAGVAGSQQTQHQHQQQQDNNSPGAQIASLRAAHHELESVDPTRSGEALIRSKNAHVPKPELVAGFKKSMADMLFADAAGCTSEGLESVKSDLRTLKDLAMKVRKNKCATLHESKATVRRTISASVRALKLKLSQYQQHTEKALQVLNQQSLTLVLHYYATIEKELEIYSRLARDEDRLCNRLESQVRASSKLSMFALHLEAETAANVCLRRLPQTHPQFLRCRRAALENVKSGFFAPDGRYTGLTVMDIFKIEHRPLLRRFQKASSSLEHGKVKGLFCSLPSGAIERVVCYGFGSDESSTLPHTSVFKGTWKQAVASMPASNFQLPETENVDWKQPRVAENAALAADVVTFPKVFSRYSTLSEDRRLVQTTQRPMTSGGSAVAPANTDEDDDGESPIRYLALCRVIVNKVYVIPKDSESFPSLPTKGSYTAMYNPKHEEYLLTDARDVLPEFIVQYKYVSKRRPGADSGGPSYIIGCDLSQPAVRPGSNVGTDRAASQHAEATQGAGSTSLLSAISAAQVAPHGDARPASSLASSRNLLAVVQPHGAHAEDGVPWNQVRSNATQQRKAALKMVRQRFHNVWADARSICTKDKLLASMHAPGRSKSAAAASRATIAALQESIQMAQRELAKRQDKTDELERELAQQQRRRKR